jgi:hypothetical protein
MRSMEANSPRRWYQFSLRTFLILVTLLAMWLGYISFRAREQQAAVRRINELGGSVQYDYQIGIYPTTSPAGWPWLRKLVGDEYFQDVVAVNLNDTKVSDADLGVIGKLRRTKRLALNRTDVSDAGLASFSGMSELDYLGLAQTKVTSNGIRCLRPPKSSSVVTLENTSVDDNALPNLSGCAELGLDGTRITSHGLKQLNSCQNLILLSIRRTAVDDEAVPILAQFTTLQWLNLTDTKISGEGLLALRKALPTCRIDGGWADISKPDARTLGLPESKRGRHFVSNVRLLNRKYPIKLLLLSSPLISDVDLWMLQDLEHLEVLDLRGASVSDKGVQKLQKAMPELKIYR